MFSEKIKVLRKSKGLTQNQFANIFSISNGTIAMWETGKRMPDVETLNRIADYFEVSIDYLMGRDSIDEFTARFRKALVETISGANPIDVKCSNINLKKLEDIAYNSQPISLETACSIAEEIGLSLDDLIDREKKEKPTLVSENGLDEIWYQIKSNPVKLKIATWLADVDQSYADAVAAFLFSSHLEPNKEIAPIQQATSQPAP